MQSKQESVTKEVKEEESLTRFGWNRKIERERGSEREKTRGGKRKRKAEVLAILYPPLLLYFSSNISNIDSRPKKAQQTSFPLPSPCSVPDVRYKRRCLLFEFSTFGDFEQKSKFQHRLYFSLSISLSRSRYWCFLLNSQVSLRYLLRCTPLRDSVYVSYKKN